MKRKKKHYMQTPAGKKHMRKMYLIRMKNKKVRNSNENVSQKDDHVAAYALGRIEKEIDLIARSTRVSVSALTIRVAELLQHQTMW